MNCQQFEEAVDSYIGDESLTKENREISHHLESCPACGGDFAAQQQLRTRLRSAVKNDSQTQINPIFARRLETNLRQSALRPTFLEKLKAGFFINSPIWAATAACLLVGVVFGAVWLRYNSVETDVAVQQQNQIIEPAGNNQPVESAQIIRAAWQEMTREAVGDHENCALHFRLREKPILLEEAAEKYDKFNKDLDKTIAAAVQNVALTENESGKSAGKIEFLDAHSCIYNRRRFAHVILRRGDKKISVLVADTDLPANANGDQIAAQSEGAMQTASFRAAQHAVFVVSDLSERENMLVAQAISPAVRRHIERSET